MSAGTRLPAETSTTSPTTRSDESTRSSASQERSREPGGPVCVSAPLPPSGDQVSFSSEEGRVMCYGVFVGWWGTCRVTQLLGGVEGEKQGAVAVGHRKCTKCTQNVTGPVLRKHSFPRQHGHHRSPTATCESPQSRGLCRPAPPGPAWTSAR